MGAPQFTEADYKRLQAQVEELQSKLGVETSKRTDAEATAMALSQAGMFTGSTE